MHQYKNIEIEVIIDKYTPTKRPLYDASGTIKHQFGKKPIQWYINNGIINIRPLQYQEVDMIRSAIIRAWGELIAVKAIEEYKQMNFMQVDPKYTTDDFYNI